MSNFRSERYRRAVAELPCVVCGQVGRTQAAHANTPPFGKGRSIQAHDWATFPMCADSIGSQGCHSQWDQHMGKTDKSRRIDVEAGYILRTMQAMVGHGQLRIPVPKKDPATVAVAIGGLIADKHLRFL